MDAGVLSKAHNGIGVPMGYISFHFLDNLFAYLKASRARTTELDRLGTQSSYSVVYLSQGQSDLSYQIPLPDICGQEPVSEEARRILEACEIDASVFDGQLNVSGTVSNKSITVNELLRLLPLRVVPNIVKCASSIIVAVPTLDSEKKDARKRLYKVWRDVPRVAQGRSRFYSIENKANYLLWVVVHIEGVDPQFRVEEWLRRNQDSGLLLFVPPDNGYDVPYLFVQWGYQYPNMADFSSLYEIGPDEHHLLLAFAGKPVEQGVLDGVDPSDAWCESHWYDATILDLVRDHELWNVSRNTKRHNYIMTVAPIEDTVDVPLELGDRYGFLGDIPDLVRKINRAEHDLAVLHSKRRRLGEMVSHREYYPVYVFTEATEKAGTPSEFLHFLCRPLTELSNYLYAAWIVEGVTTHCVVGEIPVSLDSVLTVPCTHAYIQYTRWREWQLPLFIQAGSALNVDLEEQQMAEQVREMLEREGVPEGALVLAGPSGEEPEHLRLTVVPKVNPLDQCLAYVNGRSNASRALITEAVETHQIAARQLQVDVSKDVLEALEALKGECQRLLGEAEEVWEDIRENVRQLSLMAKVGDQAVLVTQGAYESFPKQWKEFLDRVFEIDGALSQAKMSAWEEYALGETARAERLEHVQQSYRDTLAALNESEQQHKELLARILAMQENILKTIDRIYQLKVELRQSRASLENNRQTLDSENAEVRQTEESLRAGLREVERQQKELNAAWDAVRQAQKALAESKTQLASDKKKHEADQKKLLEDQKKFDSERIRFALERDRFDSEYQKYVTEKNAFDGEVQQVAEARRVLENEREKLAQARETLHYESKKLAEDQKKLEVYKQDYEHERTKVSLERQAYEMSRTLFEAERPDLRSGASVAQNTKAEKVGVSTATRMPIASVQRPPIPRQTPTRLPRFVFSARDAVKRFFGRRK